jgi:signal transduction histidine kinase
MPPGGGRRILFVAAKSDAQPVLAQLRAAGHQVSLVEDTDEARILLEFAGFDQAVVSAAKLAALLQEQWRWESADTGAWRRSTAALAHDLRALLGALESCVAALERAPASGGAAGDVRHSIAALSTLLQELAGELSGSAEELSLVPVDVEDAVEAAAVAVYPSASERRQRLVIDIDEAVRRLTADGPKLKRVLANLLQYSSQRAPRLGTVTVRVREEQGECVISVFHAAMGAAGLEARQTPGAAGLSGAQRLVELHGGRLWIESQTGGEAGVFVSLPLAGAARERPLARLTRD